MTQVSEAATLFDVDSDGRFVMPADPAEAQVAVDEAYYAGLGPVERALHDVLPDAVDIASRAGHLVNALTEISNANQRRGFVAATQTEAHGPEIQRRYGERTVLVADGAAVNALIGERRAHYEFFAASGVGRLALTNRLPVAADELDGADPEDLVYMSINRDWRTFLARYGGTGRAVNARRAAYRKLLDKQIESISENADN